MNTTLTILVCVAGVILPGLIALLAVGNPLVSIVISLCAFLIEIPCVVLMTVIWPQQRALKRRLRRVAAPLKGGILTDDITHGGGGEVSVFREQHTKSRLIERLEYQFPLVDVRKALPKAAGLGVLGAVVIGSGAVFLDLGLPASLLLLPVCWLGCSVAVLAVQDVGQRNEFTKIFPDITDQIVRLMRTGIPSMEAIAIAAEDAPPPVCEVMREISSSVAAGFDPEAALRGTAARIRIPAFSLFSAAVCLQLTTGGGISSALGNLSATLRARHGVALKAKSSTAQTRMTLMIISLVPVAVLVAQNFTNPKAVETLFNTESGGALLRYGVGLILSGLLVAHGLSARIGR